jgi:manganese transport protein
VKIAASAHCDLIALASHGHKLIGDLLHGSTIDRVRHNTTIPLLVVNASKASVKPPA